jgi:hypothetical protein
VQSFIVVRNSFVRFLFIHFNILKDLDKNYNDKLCLEYELNSSPVHLTTTDECILAALRKLASLEQQVWNTSSFFLFDFFKMCL